jgi:diguanylate cyclase (GGDEF)-like protein
LGGVAPADITELSGIQPVNDGFTRAGDNACVNQAHPVPYRDRRLKRHHSTRGRLPGVFDGKRSIGVRPVGDVVTIQEGLDTLHIGLSVFDAELRLVAFNHAYVSLLQFPVEMGQVGMPLEAFFRYNAERGEYGEGDIDALVEERLALARKFEPHSFLRRRPDGTVIEVVGRPLPSGGFVSTYTDVTEMTQTREALEQKERELMRQLEDIDLERAMVEKQAQKMVDMAEDLAVQNKQIEISRQQSDFQARHDHLTGLPNRRYFSDYLTESLETAGRAGAHKALMFVDLDNFKPVNDELGHDRGDTLLREVSLLLSNSVRDSDFVARLGGDEFAVIAKMKPENGLEGVRVVADRILDALTLTLKSETGKEFTVSASIGVAIFPDDATELTALLKMADKAMYEAKKTGRRRIVFAKELAGTGNTCESASCLPGESPE